MGRKRRCSNAASFLVAKGGSGSMYTTKQGQAWDQIALEVYGKEIYADFLMKNNPRYLNILVFPAGITLNTPALPESRKDLPSWR